MASEEQLKQWQNRLTSAGVLETVPAIGDHPEQIASFSQFLGILVEQKLLTAWQAEQLAKGRTSFLIGKYRLLAELGRGGMAQVFLAEHVTMERRVAIKLLASDLPQAAMDRFLAEVRAIAALDHPNIVHAYNVDNDGGQYYLVMEFVEGKTLDRIVQDSGPLPWKRAADIARQTALGLSCAHAKGIIHCDLKPANIIVNPEGVVKILDLGLARLVNRDRREPPTRTEDSEQVLGTVDYMAPELALSPDQVDHRVDIYSLGCVLYYALLGSPPFPEGTLAERLLKHQVAIPPDPRARRPDIPQSLADIIHRALAKSPSSRFETASEMVAALEKCLTQTPMGSGLIRARPLLEEQASESTGQTQPGATAHPSTIPAREESVSASGESSRTGTKDGDTAASGSLPAKGLALGKKETASRKSRLLRYAAGVVALVMIAILLVLFIPWKKPSGEKSGTQPRGQRDHMRTGTRGDSSPVRRPEDDPEAFRQKLEEWMRSQMGPKEAKDSGK